MSVNLALELLQTLGVDEELAHQVGAALETAVSGISDPARRKSEVAFALDELRDGMVPSIVAALFD